jgi:hypothetical protein
MTFISSPGPDCPLTAQSSHSRLGSRVLIHSPDLHATITTGPAPLPRQHTDRSPHSSRARSAERRRIEGSQRQSSNPGLVKGGLHLAKPNRPLAVAVVLDGPVHPFSCYLFSGQIHAQAIRQLPFEKPFDLRFAPICTRLAEWCFGDDLGIVVEIIDNGAELSALPCLFKKKGSEKRFSLSLAVSNEIPEKPRVAIEFRCGSEATTE